MTHNIIVVAYSFGLFLDGIQLSQEHIGLGETVLLLPSQLSLFVVGRMVDERFGEVARPQ